MICVFAGRGVSRSPPHPTPNSGLRTPPGPSPAGQPPRRGCSSVLPSCVSLSYLPLDAFCSVFELVKLHARPFKEKT